MSDQTETAFVAPVELTEAAWEAFVAGLSGVDLAYTDELRDAVTAAVATQVRDVQRRVEDFGVRAARDNSWCGVFAAVMQRAFPAGPLDGDDWRDDEGVACDGTRWTDSEGYGRDGFNGSGQDREGYDRQGLDQYGFTREGMDSDGIHRDSPDRYRFDRRGRDREGFDHNDYMSSGFSRQELEARRAAPAEDYRFDRDGFDRDGYNRSGSHRVTKRDRAGFDSGGWHVGTASYYDADGYDYRGFHRSDGSYRNPATVGVST